MRAGMNMNDRSGWSEVSCDAADYLRDDATRKSVSSSLTDLLGVFGPAVIYTEWADGDGQPVLRDYLWSPSDEAAKCEHFIPSQEVSVA